MSNTVETTDDINPEPGVFVGAGVRSIRAVIDGRPTITSYTRLRASPTYFEVALHGVNQVVRVPRNPDEPVGPALRRYLNGGA